MAKDLKNKAGTPRIVNKQARRLFHIDETLEAGLVLLGSEVKSIRLAKVNLKEGYVRVEDGEAWLVGVHISTYEQANKQNHEPMRRRKLLLHKKQITKLFGKVSRQGYTLIPMAMYFHRGKVKLEVGVGKGKKLHDKRHDQKERDVKRELDRARRR
jgi:SsrA-binding protein